MFRKRLKLVKYDIGPRYHWLRLVRTGRFFSLLGQDQVQCMVAPCRPPNHVDDVSVFSAGDVSPVKVSTYEEATAGASAILGEVVERSTLRWGLWRVVNRSNYHQGAYNIGSLL